MSRLQEYQRQEIVTKYLSNKYTTKQLAEEYGVHLSSITRLLNRKNIPLRNSRFSFNQDYFETIDTEHKAVKTEYDAVKSLIGDNVEKSFNIFG